jgi:3-oxoacyl-[acyl-carrier protein] reductase
MSTTPSSSRPLVNKVALVTGGSRGIGAAIAKRLASEGAEIILHYGSATAEATAVIAAIQAIGGKASLIQADLSQHDGAAKLAQAVSHSRIDILVNNAGIAPFSMIEETSEETFDQISNVNMRSLFFVTQKILPKIPEGGRIINISSAVTRTYFPAIPAYSASKGFVDTLTLHLAAALGAKSITVNAVAPGAIDTQMSAWIHQPGGTDTLKQIQAMPGIGQPEQIAGIVSFLAGPDGGWTTGQVIDASGGLKL